MVAGFYVSVRACTYIYISVICMCIRVLCLRAYARVYLQRGEKERNGERVRQGRVERRGRIRAGAGDQACVYTERRQEWRGGGGWKEGEINVFVLRPPSYAPGREKVGSPFSREKISRRGGWPRRRGPAPRQNISPALLLLCAKDVCFAPVPPPPSPPIYSPSR